MLDKFICPDGEVSKVTDCLLTCRLGERCMTLPTLMAISQERVWSGKASTTQLLNGTMMEFLKLTKPYTIDPDSRAFMLGGTKHHAQLEVWARELNLPAEVAMSVDRDIFDLLEFEGTKLVMTDYKNWGSFRVAKALGIVEVGKEPDPSGAKYKTDSKFGKAGSPKMVPVWGVDPAKIDLFEPTYQLNRYRVMLAELKVIIHKLQLQVTVRDGGLYIAKDRGVMRNIYKIPIPLVPDKEIIDYFDYKNNCLMEAMKSGCWVLPCSPIESWEGERCKGYCDVWNYCSKGQLVHGIGGKNAS